MRILHIPYFGRVICPVPAILRTSSRPRGIAIQGGIVHQEQIAMSRSSGYAMAS